MKYNQPIPRRKLAHEVRDRLLAMIESGDLACGDKMPSEHTIMDMFKVGRPAVREALQSLEGLGVISISHGERATVCAINAETILGQILSAIEKKDPDLAARMLSDHILRINSLYRAFEAVPPEDAKR
jgi:DNA-binding FadR family transcriptional regulator